MYLPILAPNTTTIVVIISTRAGHLTVVIPEGNRA